MKPTRLWQGEADAPAETAKAQADAAGRQPAPKRKNPDDEEDEFAHDEVRIVRCHHRLPNFFAFLSFQVETLLENLFQRS